MNSGPDSADVFLESLGDSPSGETSAPNTIARPLPLSSFSSIPYTVQFEINPESTAFITSSPGSPSLSATHKESLTLSSLELNLRHTVDFRAITYDGTIDENLMCPICRCPLVNPVLTDCDHIFCRECIGDSLSHSELCPIDRFPLSLKDLMKAPKMVFNQLDSLKAKCPCCNIAFARSMLEHHMEKYCPESLVRCSALHSSKKCAGVVKRRLSDQGCLHYQVQCPDCMETLEQAQMEDHCHTVCKQRLAPCEHCTTIILRHKKVEHEESCSEVCRPCQWKEYGCSYEAKQDNLQLHNDKCTFKLFGAIAENIKKEVNDLRKEVGNLKETNHLQERRIKFLESGQKASEKPFEFMDSSDANLSDTANAETLDTGHEYLLSLLEVQQNRISNLAAELSELRAKHTVMLFNETIPMKNELAELRSTQQVTCMHVRWLMRFRMQENQRRFGGGPGPAPSGPDGGGPSNEMPLGRRLSDSMTRDLITKL
ncbi:hypothetical protein G7Y89_g10137 [Cudoniella acicularis]|uniref:Uncharacterized protein n=1 Tax=Cudoniella acicularis TaxID=354080 RepID=A0A8H4RDC4_9HELO|nr:hypothetical protein G7Y89_g10137 [Cudoniella acicularis]